MISGMATRPDESTPATTVLFYNQAFSTVNSRQNKHGGYTLDFIAFYITADGQEYPAITSSVATGEDGRQGTPLFVVSQMRLESRHSRQL